MLEPYRRNRGRAARIEALALAAVLLLGLGLRLYRLDHQSLWNDEGTSVALALRSLPTITRQAAADIHPPLYYYLLHGWMRLFGTGEGAVRALSVLLGVGLVWGTFTLARRFFGVLAALFAALLTALSPFQVYYSQEARMYILATFAALLSCLALERLIAARSAAASPRKQAGGAALYLLATMAAAYSHYLAFGVVAAQNVAVGLWLVSRLRIDGRPPRAWWREVGLWAGLQALVAALYLPWVAVSWHSLTSWPAVSVPLSFLGLLRRVAQVMAVGVAVPDGRAEQLLALALALPVLVGMVTAWERGGRRRRGALAAALYVIVPVLLMYALSAGRPMYKPKFALLAAPGYHILQGAGLAALAGLVRTAARTRLTDRARVAAGATAAGLGVTLTVLALARPLLGVYTDARYFRDDYRGIVRYVEATAGPGDAILINAPSQIETVDYYYDGPLPMVPLPLQRPIDTEITRGALEDLIAAPDGGLVGRRIYAIFWATDESDPERFIEGWLDRHTFKTIDSWFGDIRLAVYAVPEETPTVPTQSLDLAFGDVVRLEGYALGSGPVESGSILPLALFWRALSPMDGSYKVFVHLVDARGEIVGQRDSEPVGGSRPTYTWEAGERLVDPYGIMVPPGTPPGPHTLRVGLYRSDDGQRLAIHEGDAPRGDILDLAVVEVVRPDVAPPIGAFQVEHTVHAEFRGLYLLGHSLARLGYEHLSELDLHAGDTARLVLVWERGGNGAPPEALTLALRDGRGRTAWESRFEPTGGLYPLERWQPGERVRDSQSFVIPADLAPTTYALVLYPSDRPEEAHRLERLALRPPR